MVFLYTDKDLCAATDLPSLKLIRASADEPSKYESLNCSFIASTEKLDSDVTC